ncbi:pantoate--beta-alanine ligase [Roseisolibacter sp. H3M3-2]|uniref:pantoate--beta-alanine ligase n=1 Tax=Roseisolibacter sp. H3M3-2 TaxID=3031323 RepID=UPI0023DBBF95|nr:pantoate--beta-alanine ligase [Roseisolibacter sp. H3M3-2]MDF1501538.1 pantoate--beta-alanine ligase [Roseisolibacter sp. H3M3-2]
MLTVTTAGELREELRRLREDARVLGGGRVGFVPTMGALHEGHLALVDEARRRADVAAMSIFVNPLQFGPSEDLSRYPRDPDGDAAKARARGVQLLFAPGVEVIYPREPLVRIDPGALAQRWEGAARPGHFAGVLTVVAKLLHLVQPDVAVFGQKDVQQATLIRAMVRDLDLPVELVIAPTVREPDGLALSSRNVYLDPDERRRARVIPAALARLEAAYAAGERRVPRLVAEANAVLALDPQLWPDYVAVADPETLEPLDLASDGAIAMIALRVGKTRLLDNAILGVSPRIVAEPPGPPA